MVASANIVHSTVCIPPSVFSLCYNDSYILFNQNTMPTPALGIAKLEHHGLVVLTLATKSSVSSHSPFIGMGRWKRTYGTYGEGAIGKGQSLWNVNKEYRK